MERLSQEVEAMTKEEIMSVLVSNKDLGYNKVTVDLLTDWGERLGALVKNPYTQEYYPRREREEEWDEFLRSINLSYDDMNTRTGISSKLIYVEIPRIRERVCQQLRIGRPGFDRLLRRLALEKPGEIELASAPVTTSAKTSPFGIKLLQESHDPKGTSITGSEATREGLSIGGKEYFYIAIHKER
jgi:hypothetical protein